MAYARGVNYYIEAYRGRYPLEFTLLGYDPRPWTPVDCMLAGLQMYRILTESWHDEARKLGMLAGGDAAKVNALFPPRSGRESQPGSNAWAVSGAHTASGKPILENDPHLEFSAPSAWYMIHLKAPGLNVIGVSLPGMPAVIVGHNDRIAWGVTNLQFDVEDLYDEKLDPRTGRYLFNGKVEQARADREFIRVKGARTDELLVWVTRHGPVIFADGSHYYALALDHGRPWHLPVPLPGYRPRRELDGVQHRAGTPARPRSEFRICRRRRQHRLSRHRTSAHSHELRRDPARGRQLGPVRMAGLDSVRPSPGLLQPRPGPHRQCESKPVSRKIRLPGERQFRGDYRSTQIRDLLAAREHWKPADMLTVEKDVYSGFERFLALQVVAAYDRKKPSDASLAEAVSVLRGWNGQMEIPLAAPMLARLVYVHVREAFAKSAAPAKWELYSYAIAPSVIQTLLESGAKGWFADKDAMLLNALRQAIDDGEREQGSRISRWNYGEFNALTIEQPVDSKIPLVGRYFDIGPIKMSGGPETVKQIRNRLGPSMHFVADLSNWDNSLNNITLGESSNIFSGHYSDQWETYYYGHSLPMQFTHVDAKDVLRVRPAK